MNEGGKRVEPLLCVGGSCFGRAALVLYYHHHRVAVDSPDSRDSRSVWRRISIVLYLSGVSLYFILYIYIFFLPFRDLCVGHRRLSGNMIPDVKAYHYGECNQFRAMVVGGKKEECSCRGGVGFSLPLCFFFNVGCACLRESITSVPSSPALLTPVILILSTFCCFLGRQTGLAESGGGRCALLLLRRTG